MAGAAPNYGAGGVNNNIYQGVNGIGNPYCVVEMSIVTPGSASPNCASYDIWCQWTDSVGNPINPGGAGNTPGWQHGGDIPNDGTTWRWSSGTLGVGLWINYPGAGIDGYLTIQVWGRNHNSPQSGVAPYAGDSNAVLQQWPGGLTYYRLHVGPPPSTLDLTLTNPTTLQNNLAQNSSGQVGVNTANLSNILLNGGFENGALGSAGAGWVKSAGTEWGLEATSGFAYTGTQYFRTDVGIVNGGVHQTGISCRPGDTFYVEAYINAILSITGYVYIYVGWFNAVGTNLFYASSSPLSIYGGMGWTKISGNFVAPASASSLIVYIQTPGTSGSGAWYVDNVFMDRPVSTSGVVTIDANGAVTHSGGCHHGGEQCPGRQRRAGGEPECGRNQLVNRRSGGEFRGGQQCFFRGHHQIAAGNQYLHGRCIPLARIGIPGRAVVLFGHYAV